MGKFSVQIDQSRCIGCRLCAVVCPEGVLDLYSDTVAYAADLEKCIGCHKCEECPEGAVKVIA